MSSSAEPGAPSPPRAAVSGLVRRPGAPDQILVVRRGAGPGAGQWALPGGSIEAGEPARAALRRELIEEADLDVEVGPLIDFAEAILPERHYVILVFACQAERDRIRAGTDAAEARWARPMELAALPLTPGTRQVLARQGVLPADG